MEITYFNISSESQMLKGHVLTCYSSQCVKYTLENLVKPATGYERATDCPLKFVVKNHLAVQNYVKTTHNSNV